MHRLGLLLARTRGIEADYGLQRSVPDISELATRYEKRQEMAEHYIEAYRRYCWTVHSLADLKLAPFHLLASEGKVHTAKDHVWHMRDAGSSLCG